MRKPLSELTLEDVSVVGAVHAESGGLAEAVAARILVALGPAVAALAVREVAEPIANVAGSGNRG